jgi:hypothetical protein
MTTKKTTDQSAASFAAQAQREFGELRSAREITHGTMHQWVF